jgi:hypothetical protein
MIRDAKGAWLISGCSLVRSERQET